MNIKTKLMISIMLPMFSACSTQSVQPELNTSTKPVDSEISVTKIPSEHASLMPALTKIKAGKTLKLSRIMEGGACNNNQQGAVGLFSLYANPDDITRIKQQQGPDVFASFESLIETFSMRALQLTVDRLDFKSGIDALNKNHVQQLLADRFAELFAGSIAEDITEFEAKTTLMIDVISQPDSLTIYQDNCKTPHAH
jgi:hypothetical protein